MGMNEIKIGIDIGGTFTDIVVLRSDGSFEVFKVLTNPKEPWISFIRGIKNSGVSLSDVHIIVHATTLGSNLLLGQVGLEIPNIVLLTNEGFRDILEIGRQNRPELYNLFFERPKPLVPRSRRLGIRGRIGADGTELEPLDIEGIKEVARKWCGKADVFAIAFLHSYKNPVHEIRAKEVIKEVCPNAEIVLSSEVDPQPKEYERMSTTVVNAVLKPILSKYLAILKSELVKRGFKGKLLIMQSNGGVVDSNRAIEVPAAFIESGPAAGVVATAYISKPLGIDNALSFDMGGTTAKVATVLDGEPLTVAEFEVGGRTHMGKLIRGSGYIVRYPFVDLVEVSAGGGTIAWIDAGGALRIGPMSAGADPGPACYGRGGIQVTITDANFVLNRLPNILAGGKVILRKDLAVNALRRLAESLGLDVYETAYAVIRLANTLMSRAIRLVTIERGLDPRKFTLFAFGGAGPLHAAEIAIELGISRVIVPPYPGVFSALGLLLVDYRHEAIASVLRLVDELRDESIETLANDLESKLISALISEGIPKNRIRIMKFLDMRYHGQEYTITVPYRGSLNEAIKEFHRNHLLRYGYTMSDEVVEVTTLRITAIGLVNKPKILRKVAQRNYKPKHVSYRNVYFKEWVRTPIYRRESLKAGACIEGPAIIESNDSTILIPPGLNAYVNHFNLIVIEVKPDGSSYY